MDYLIRTGQAVKVREAQEVAAQAIAVAWHPRAGFCEGSANVCDGADFDSVLLPLFGTERSRLGCAIMKRFFFDLVGDIRAHDFMGHECLSKKEAKKHAAFIAHRIGTERPSFAKRETTSLSATNGAQRYLRHP